MFSERKPVRKARAVIKLFHMEKSAKEDIMKSQIHLIRHGITEGNLKRLVYGSSDIPLAEEGIRQLEKLAGQGLYPQVGEGDFYTTGLIRAEQTLEIIYGQREHEVIGELREMGFGRFEMKSQEELMDLPEYMEWNSDKSGKAESPGGESFEGFSKRIVGGFQTLYGKHRLKELSVRHSGKDAISVLVCHAGTIAAIMEEYFPGRTEHFFEWVPDPGHGYTLLLEKSEIIGYEDF